MESTEFQMIEQRALAMDRDERGQLASSLLRSLDEQPEGFAPGEGCFALTLALAQPARYRKASGDRVPSSIG